MDNVDNLYTITHGTMEKYVWNTQYQKVFLSITINHSLLFLLQGYLQDSWWFSLVIFHQERYGLFPHSVRQPLDFGCFQHL